MSGEALQIAEKRREEKGKGEKEKYTHLNAEFKRIARRDKKDFLSDQCEEIGENNRMGKTRDLFKKARDTKGTFHASSITLSGPTLKSHGLLELAQTHVHRVGDAIQPSHPLLSSSPPAFYLSQDHGLFQ